MSKIGRKPISITKAKVALEDNKVVIQGGNEKIEHVLPEVVVATLKDNVLTLTITERTRQNKALWGLHRALIANKIHGLEKGFEKKVTIVGLGYKAVLAGDKLTFSLGFTNKIEYTLPKGVSVVVDKSGQNLVFKSFDKFLLGFVCDQVRSFRFPEPYKGTGIIREGDIIIRKAGKAKSA